MLDVSGGLTERCGCEEVKRPFWNHSGGSKSFVQDQVCVLMQSKQFAKQAYLPVSLGSSAIVLYTGMESLLPLLLQACTTLAYAYVLKCTQSCHLVYLESTLGKGASRVSGIAGQQVQVSGLAACCACRGAPATLLAQRLRGRCLSG